MSVEAHVDHVGIAPLIRRFAPPSPPWGEGERAPLIRALLLLLLVVFAPVACTPAAPPPAHDHAAEKAEVWTCPMHPSVRVGAPGACPICGMDLVLAAGDGAVTVDATQRGQLGIRVEAAVARDMFTVTTSSGVVGWDSTRLHEVGARVEARVERVHVRVGQRVGRGDTLFTVSGLEIAATLAELRRASAVEAGDPRGPADRAATEARLAGWGLTPGSGDTATVRSPAAGVVTELGALAGATVANGQILARLADPRAVTAEAWLPEDAAVPSEARVHAPGRSVAAKVLVAEPAVDPATRTRRVVFAAEGLDLPAGAYVSVEIEGAGGAQVAVPVDAVVYTGPRRVVYVAEGDRFVPRTVEVGPRDEGWIAITSGLTVGEQVVTDGVFLIAADSRLRAVTP